MWKIDDGDRKAEIDAHRNEQSNKHKEGRGEWKGELGSQSENAVCAVRSHTEGGAGVGVTFLSPFLPSVSLLVPLIPPTPAFTLSQNIIADCPNARDQVKADRGEMEHADKDIEQLQKETANKANDAARVK